MAKQPKTDARAPTLYRQTANDRFKRRFGAWLWGSVIVATFVHFALIKYFPTLRAADFSFRASELETIELPPEIKIPPRPEAIKRPALPVVAKTELEEDITIAPTTFDENPVNDLPPPPSDRAAGLGDQPVFTPYTVAPALRDPRRATRIVERQYPRLLKDAGIGGTVVVWAFIDEVGLVKNTAVNASSGYAPLDEAASRAVLQFEFRPALNRDETVPVWVALPITFKIR